MLRIAAYAAYAFLLLPTVLIAVASVNSAGYIGFPLAGLSVRWYEAFFRDPQMVNGLWLSFIIAGTTVVGTLILGTSAALHLARSPRGTNLMVSAFMSPASVPLVLTGFALLIFFTQVRLIGTAGLIIGHIVVTVPFVLRTVLGSLVLADPALPRAAAILGASPWRTFWLVTLPLIRPGLVAGALFSFLSSFNNITVSVFIASPGATPLPVVIFSRIENLAEPTAAAAATLVIALTAVGLLVLDRRYSFFASVSPYARAAAKPPRAG